MNKKIFFAVILATVTLLAFCFSGCSPQGDGGKAHTCKNVCATCGKCLDAGCKEDACKEKCQGHGGGETVVPVTGKNEYVFDFMAGYGIVKNAAFSSDKELNVNKVTDFNWKSKSEISAEIYAAEELEADVVLKLSATESETPVTGIVMVELNGFSLESDATVPEKNDQPFASVNLGKFTLDKGENVFRLVAYGETEVCSLSLYADEENALKWTAEEVNGKYYPGIDDSVELSGDYEKNVLQNCIRAAGYSPSKATFKINSPSACKAVLSIGINSMARSNVLSDYYDIRINGTKLMSAAVTVYDDVLWANYRVIRLGEIDLASGENEISFSVGAVEWNNAFNIRGIYLKTEAE